MKDYILERKIARVISIIAQRLNISQAKALTDFYQSRLCAMLHDEKTEMHLMSDEYLADEYIIEIKNCGVGGELMEGM